MCSRQKQSKRLAAVLVIQILWLVLVSCNTAGSNADDANGTRGSDMLETNGIAYPTRFANYQKNSHAPVSIGPKGRVLWSKAYDQVLPGSHLAPRDVLVCEAHVGLRAADDLLVFMADGSFTKHIPIGHNTMVVFGKDAYAYAKPAYLLEYRNYAGALQLEMSEFPALREYTSTLLFCPMYNDLLAAVQFDGGPEKFPKRYDVFLKPLMNAHRAWTFDAEGIIEHALLTPDMSTVVVLQKNQAFLLDALSGSKKSALRIPTDSVITASLDLSGNLVVIGDKTVDGATIRSLTVLEQSGRTLWTYALAAWKGNQPPVCGPDGAVYVCDDGWIKCLKNGEPVWMAEFAPSARFWLTSTGDRKLILLSGARLLVFGPEGQSVADVTLPDPNEAFDVPPAPDNAGRIFVAGSTHLYCID